MKTQLLTLSLLIPLTGQCLAQPVATATPAVPPASVPPQTTAAAPMPTDEPSPKAKAPSRAQTLMPAAQQAPKAKAEAPSPVQTLRLAFGTLRTFLRQQPPPSGPEIAHFLDTKIAPLFDFQTMARQAGGRWYARLTPEKRAAMAEEMKRLFLTRLTEALLLYQNQEVRFLRPRISTDGREADVTMLIIDPRSYPARIDFRVALDGPRWRIIDIAANGSRATVYYRHMLAREMARRAWYRQQAVRQPIPPAPMGGMDGVRGMPPVGPGRPYAPWR